MENPYESPSLAKAAAVPTRSRPVSLVILGCALFLTFAFAVKNVIDEGYALVEPNTILLVLIAGAGQIPGVFIAHWRWKKRSAAAIPMLFGAYVVAVLGCGAYAWYAFNGKADSLHSAAHMHVVAFPLVHAVLAIGIYLGCGVVSAAIHRANSLPGRHHTDNLRAR